MISAQFQPTMKQKAYYAAEVISGCKLNADLFTYNEEWHLIPIRYELEK